MALKSRSYFLDLVHVRLCLEIFFFLSCLSNNLLLSQRHFQHGAKLVKHGKLVILTIKPRRADGTYWLVMECMGETNSLIGESRAKFYRPNLTSIQLKWITLPCQFFPLFRIVGQKICLLLYSHSGWLGKQVL